MPPSGALVTRWNTAMQLCAESVSYDLGIVCAYATISSSVTTLLRAQRSCHKSISCPMTTSSVRRSPHVPAKRCLLCARRLSCSSGPALIDGRVPGRPSEVDANLPASGAWRAASGFADWRAGSSLRGQPEAGLATSFGRARGRLPESPPALPPADSIDWEPARDSMTAQAFGSADIEWAAAAEGHGGDTCGVPRARRVTSDWTRCQRATSTAAVARDDREYLPYSMLSEGPVAASFALGAYGIVGRARPPPRRRKR